MLYQGQMSHIQTLYKLLSKFSHAINFYIGPLHYKILALFPAPAQLSVACSTVSGRGPGIFSHVSDVRIERVVERV